MKRDNMDTKRDMQEENEGAGFALRYASRLDALRLKDADIVRMTGLSSSALSRYRAGGAPKAAHLFKLADALKCSPRWLLSGEDEPENRDSGEIAYLPIATAVTASAGHGSVVDGDEGLAAVPFPTRWIRQEFGDPANLALIQVEGDSMSPDFPSGSWVMFDRGRRGPATGTYVLRLNGVVNIKDVQFRSIDIVVTSKHVGYVGANISLREAADPSIFEVLGRVVWSGNLLA